MTDRTIKVRLEAEVSQYQKNMDDAAKATELLAAKADVAAKKVDHAANVQKSAAEKVKAAEENLKKVRSDSKATADQVRAAEEGLTKAKLDESSASLTLRESTQGLEKAQRAQGDAAEIQSSKMKRAGAFWKENRADIDKTATSLMVVGGAGVAALGLMTKQAISWESAWAGVTKTVNATDAELASLQAGLRQMATELPATHEEIAAVAAAAGQLGIQTPNILNFTRTMIDLGESTNLSAEEAATSLARLMNIMGTSQSDVGRLGSTIVGLGNNFATTESEIMAMSLRLAGAGKQAGLTESDVMGIAAAMSSVGIEADAGGTAMSLTMKRIAKEVETGGDKLGMFARVAGLSSEQFSKAWGDDASGALSLFVDGLSNTESLGMSTNAVLGELGITGIRESDALLRMSGAHGLLNEALDLSGRAYADNTALIEEAGARYATTESQIKIAGNTLKDAGIEIGSYVLPILADLASGVGNAAQMFADLPDPVKRTITAVGGFGSVTALAVGGTLKLAGSVSDSLGAMKRLADVMPRTSSAMIGLSKGAGAAGIAVAALFALEQWTARRAIELDIEVVTEKLLDLADAAPGAQDAIEELFRVEMKGGLNPTIGIDGIADALRRVTGTDLAWFEKAEKNFAWLPGINDDGLQRAADGIEKMDQSMASLVQSGNADKAEASWNYLKSEADALGISTEELTAILPEYSAALKAVENDTRLAADATAEAEAAAAAAQAEIDALGQAFDAQAAAADAAWDALHQWVSDAISAEKAAMNYESAIDDVSAALEKNGKTLDIGSEKGRANRDVLHGIAQAGDDVIKIQREQGASEEELQEIMQRTRDDLIASARQFGMTADEAVAYADKLGLIPENVDSEVLLATQKAEAKRDQLLKDLSIAGMSLTPWKIDGDGWSAIDEATKTKVWIDRQTGRITIDGEDDEAKKKAKSVVDSINKSSASIPMTAHTTKTGNAAIDAMRASIRTPISVPVTFKATNTLSGAIGGARPRAMGGRAGTGKPLPSFSVGGRLPRTGLGTDKILGINSAGLPTAWVDDEEMLVNKRMTDKFEDVLYRINADHPSVQHMANGAPPQYQTAPHVAMANPSAAIDYDKLAAAVARAQGPSTAPQVNVKQVINNPLGVPTVTQVRDGLASVAAITAVGNV